MRRTLVIVGLMLVSAAAALAQDTTLKIRIDEIPGGSQDAGGQVRTDVLPMISGNPHYTLVSDTSWDLHLLLNCVYATSGSDNQRIGVNCANELIYQPDKWGGIMDAFGPYIELGPDEDSVAKQSFADLIDATTVDNIKKADDYITQIVSGIYKVASSSASSTAKPCTVSPKSPANASGQPVPH
ncbi:MAG: hypothetical protein WBF06_03090 [Candidatus Acidiferrales bacterium]